MNAKRLRRMKRGASRLPAAMEHVAFTKWTGDRERNQRSNRLARDGAASDVRVIDPKSGEVVRVIAAQRRRDSDLG